MNAHFETARPVGHLALPASPGGMRAANTPANHNIAATMKLDSCIDLFFDQLRDLLSVERQLQDSLPDLLRRARASDLRQVISDHIPENRRQRERLEAIFAEHGVKFGNDVSKAVAGLIEGGDEHLAVADDPCVADLLIIAHSSRIKHYEMAGYGFAACLGDCVGFAKEAGILNEILGEERAMHLALLQAAAGLFAPCTLEGGVR
jgi:Mn-containing catalase